LIEGIVFMPPPVSDTHSDRHDSLHHVLSVYARATVGVKSRISPSLRLDNRNEFQPDCLLRIASHKVGRSWVASDNYIEGAPELVAEVAVSSADYDAHEKRVVYERLGVQEYLLWQVKDSTIEWWELAGGTYVSLQPRKDGVHCSRVFPGLWIELRALLDEQSDRVQKVLERGLKSVEHAAFVKRLAAAK
jgi:Uma2 family endonuclease